MRRNLVALVLALAVVGAGYSFLNPTDTTVSQTPVAARAQRQVRHWVAEDQADLKAVKAECPGTPLSCVVDARASRKLFIAEKHLARAELHLDRAEGEPTTTTPGATTLYFPSPG